MTIVTFRKDHQAEFKSVFVDVLRLRAEAGLVKVGRVALDGTKVRGNASLAANRSAKAIQKEVDAMLAEAAEIDQREDDEFGKDRQGDEPPASMRSREDRLRRLRERKARLDAETKKAPEDQQANVDTREAEEKKTGRKKRGRKPKSAEDARKEKQEAKANVTDPADLGDAAHLVPGAQVYVEEGGCGRRGQIADPRLWRNRVGGGLERRGRLAHDDGPDALASCVTLLQGCRLSGGPSGKGLRRDSIRATEGY